MKQTGLKWCPFVPDDWDVLPAKQVFIKNKREISEGDEVVTCFRDGEVTLRKNRRATGYTESEEFAGFQGVRVNDLVVHQMDAFAGSIGVSDSNGMCTSVYHCCTPIKEQNVHYFKYLLRYMAMSGYIASLGKGIRERSTDFSFNIFGRQLLVIPPIEVQNKIARYLDDKVSEISACIADREKERSLLRLFKRAKVNEVITRGLQDNVQVKDSGVPAIGLIPEHWDVKRFKSFARTVKGKSVDYLEEPVDNSQIVLTLETLRSDSPQFYNYAVCDDPEQRCTPEDIIVIWDGAGVGEFLRAKEGLISSTTAKIALDEQVVFPNFFWYFGGRIEEVMKRMPTGMGIPHLNPVILATMEFALPPLHEQREIAEYLDEECRLIDEKCALIDEQIAKLQLLKRSLIREVVTGKRQIQ